jgi:hypothetical protein
MENEASTAVDKGCTSWLAGGLKIQDMQYDFRAFSKDVSDHDLVK